MVRGEQDFALKHPITRQVGGQEEVIDTVTLRRPVAKDMRLIDNFQSRPIALVLAMIEQLSGLTMLEVDKLDAEDVEMLGEFALAPVPSGQKAGATD
jgi:Phage tail assembly chaperone proteins, E, or 41 or 14